LALHLAGIHFEPFPFGSKSLNLRLFSAWRPTRENLVQRRPKPLQLWTCRMGSVRSSLLRSKLLYGKGKGQPSPPMRSCVQKPLPLRHPAPAVPKAKPVQVGYYPSTSPNVDPFKYQDLPAEAGRWSLDCYSFSVGIEKRWGACFGKILSRMESAIGTNIATCLGEVHPFCNACVAVVPSGQLAGHPCNLLPLRKVSGILTHAVVWTACRT
jgi:hypothetical protein